MQFHTYIDHCEMRLLDDIAIYSGWFTCGSCVTYPHLPKCDMRQFNYMQYIFIDPSISAPPILTCRDMDVMSDDYINHLAPDEAQSPIAPSD